jgi:hypothetical protein
VTSVSDAPDRRTDAEFELDALEVRDGRLVLTGHWHGVRGLRFVRPTLVIGDRSVLATLDDKPWAPDADPWRAEFPWDDAAPTAQDLTLAVAPSVSVPVGNRQGLPPAIDVPAVRAVAPPASDPADGARALAAAERETARLREQLAEAEEARDAALRSRRRMAAEAEKAVEAREAAERTVAQERDTRASGARHASSLEARLTAAERERDDAVRARTRAEAERDAARADAVAARAEAAEADAERTRIRGHRDEVLAAHDALDRRVIELQAHLHDADHAGEPPPRDTQTAPTIETAPATENDSDAAEQAPIGVRRIPAVRATAESLLSPKVERHMVTEFDVWAIRILGSVTALCFIVLLFMLARVIA